MTRYSLLCLLLLLSGCPIAPPEQVVLGQPGKLASLPSQDITLLNWNIYKQYDQAHWQEELDSLLASWSPDLITLQEVNLEPGFNGSPFPEGWGYQFGANLVTTLGGYSGVMTASTANARASRVLVSKVREPVTDTPKLILLTRYALSQSHEQLLVANIHGINFVTHDEFAIQLSRLTEQLVSHQGPIILSGDFNTWAEERLSLLNETTRRMGLKPVPYPKGRKAFFDSPLDHVFHSQELELQEVALPRGFDSSDHPPMVARFRLLVAFDNKKPDV